MAAARTRYGLRHANLTRIGLNLGNIPTTRLAMGMGMTDLNSTHQVCPFPSSEDILTVDEGICRWRFKNREIENVLASDLGTRGDMGKRRSPLNSAHQRGPSTFWKDNWTVDQSVCRWSFKNHEIEDVLASHLRTSGDMAKRWLRLDSAHQIGLETIFNGILKMFGRWYFARDVIVTKNFNFDQPYYSTQ